jgi:uncharacterized membrane protein YfcA
MLIGLAAGFQSGLLGVGGGIIMVPAMVFLLGMNQHRAHGTSLAVMPLLVTMGLIEYGKQDKLDWPMAIALAAGGVIGATIGARLAGRLSGSKLRRLFAVFLVIIGAKMTWDVAPVVFNWGEKAAVQSHTLVNCGIETLLIMLAVGVFTGILSGLLGIGGGILMIPAMVLLLGMEQTKAQGISLAVIIPVSISGTLIHYAKGNVDIKTAFWVGLGGMIGACFGARLANNLDPGSLRLIFGLFVLVIGGLMFRKRNKGLD